MRTPSVAAAYSGAIFGTSDGGNAWSPARLPADLGPVASIDCASTSCLAIATKGPAIVQHGQDWSIPSVILTNG